MEIRTTYIGTLNGVYGFWCGFKPEGLEVTEERKVLYPTEGYDLEKDGEIFSSVWLKDGMSEEDYKEVEHKESEEELPIIEE
mgnify:CR=1 FL=1